jgi:hypothetical protein
VVTEINLSELTSQGSPFPDLSETPGASDSFKSDEVVSTKNDLPTTTEIEQFLQDMETKEIEVTDPASSSKDSTTLSDVNEVEIEGETDQTEPSIVEMMMEENEISQHGGSHGSPVDQENKDHEHIESHLEDEAADSDENDANSHIKRTVTACLIFPIAQVIFFLV